MAGSSIWIYIDDAMYDAWSTYTWANMAAAYDEISMIDGKAACNGSTIYLRGAAVNESDEVEADGKYTTVPPEAGFYVGVDTPVYGPDTTETVTVSIATNNIGQYFTVANGSFYFAGSGNTFTTNNAGLHGTTASTTLTLKRAMRVTFTYVYSSEAGYDKFSLKVGSSYVVQNVSGATTSRTYGPAQLEAGTQIVFTYYKDGSGSGYNDRCFFTNMQVSYEEPVPGEIVGYEGVAHRAGKVYVSVDGVARAARKAYIGVGGVARLCYAAQSAEEG